jgi:hypothetical protein
MRILVIILAFALTSCATTEMIVGENNTITWKSKTLLKNVKDAHVVWGTFEATLGSSVGDKEVIDAAMQTVDAQKLLNMCEADFTNYVERSNNAKD